MTLLRRSLFILLVICLGCVAQSAPPDLVRKIEHQVRTFYSLPPDVKVTVGSVTPSSEVPGYDSIAVKLDDGGKQKDYTFLLSKDRATMLRVTKFDLSKDAYSDLMSKIDVTGRPSRGAKGARFLRNMVTGSRSSTRITLSRRFIPGPFMLLLTQAAWRRRTATRSGILPTTSTPISRSSTVEEQLTPALMLWTRWPSCKGNGITWIHRS